MSGKAAISSLFAQQYTLDMLRDEARQLVEKGLVSCQQPIFALCRYIPSREWPYLECELENGEYLLRDRIIDLIGTQDWPED